MTVTVSNTLKMSVFCRIIWCIQCKPIYSIFLAGIDRDRHKTMMHAASKESRGLRARRTVKEYADRQAFAVFKFFFIVHLSI